MTLFFYNVVSSVFIALGQHFFEFIEFSVPVFSMFTKLASVVFLLYLSKDFIIITGYVNFFFVSGLSLVLSYLKVYVRNYKISETLERNPSQHYHEFFVHVPLVNLFLLVTGIIALVLMDVSIPRLYWVYLVFIVSYSVYRIKQHLVKYELNLKDLDYEKSKYLVYPILLEALVNLLSTLFFESAMLTIVLTQLYEVHLLYRYHRETRSFKPFKVSKSYFFFGVITTLKTFLLYLEYLLLIDPLSFVFSFTGDLVAFWMVYLYFSA